MVPMKGEKVAWEKVDERVKGIRSTRMISVLM
jgi:hypothetical protein